jgi:hypothetical protein
MFKKFIIDFKDSFEKLSDSAKFEDIAKGRKGANLVDFDNGVVSLVRTTTIYQNTNQKFSKIHYDIIDKIKEIAEYKGLALNNALMEIYSDEYRSMGFHTDQGLDLKDDSYICIFSCYKNPIENEKHLRKLIIKNKTTDDLSEILLEQNSVVVFSVDTNQKHLHKIILESPSNNLWLGVTFRLSKTFIYFQDDLPYFLSNKKMLVMGEQDQRREFYKYKGIENKESDFKYPDIDFSISDGDFIPLK